MCIGCLQHKRQVAFGLDRPNASQCLGLAYRGCKHVLQSLFGDSAVVNKTTQPVFVAKNHL